METKSTSLAEDANVMPNTPSRHPTLWYNDGNVVLITARTLYAVHRSILSHHSPVFKDMFEMPPVELEHDELIEGRPVVRMHDSDDDLQVILELIFEHKYVDCFVSIFMLL